MIHVLCHRGSDGEILDVEVKGHAGGEKDRDIHCAGISAMIQMTAYTFRDVMRNPVQFEMGKGYFHITGTGVAVSEVERTRQVILKGLVGSLKGFADHYPDHIQMETQTSDSHKG